MSVNEDMRKELRLVTDLGHGLPSLPSAYGQPSADSGGQRKLIPGYAQEHLSLGMGIIVKP